MAIMRCVLPIVLTVLAPGIVLAASPAAAMSAPPALAAIQRESSTTQQQPTSAEAQLVSLANGARAAHGLGPLRWDPSLARAAAAHARRMASEGQIAHRYGGEPDLAERTSQAGAHFRLVEENIAVGESPTQIHEAWMHSSGHYANLMNPDIDRIGVSIVGGNGVLYAVADYSQSVAVMNASGTEAAVARTVAALGIATTASPARVAVARAYCALDTGVPNGISNTDKAWFVMRWQSSSLGALPDVLTQRIHSGHYHLAVVGACPAEADSAEQAAFTAYRLAVLLY